MSGGWTPYDPRQANPTQANPSHANPDPTNPGPWSPPSTYSPPSTPSGGYGAPGAYSQPNPYPGAANTYPGANAYPGAENPYPGAPRPTRAPSVAGIAVASVGAALAVLGLFLNWYARGSAHAGVKELVQATKLDGAPGFAQLYFGWALWVVLAIAIGTAISANLAGSSVPPLAVGGAVAGVISTVLTYAALNAGRTSGSPFDHAAVGLWLFLLGPLILAAGALLALARPPR